MKPIEFPEQTGVLARPPDMTDEECGSMPVYQGKLGQGKSGHKFCLSCWRMGWWERVRLLLHGRVWVWVISGSATQPPICLDVRRSQFK